LDWLRFWDYTAADWADLQLLVLVVAAIVAWRQVKEARRLREAQAQPFVVVDFEVEEQSHQIFWPSRTSAGQWRGTSVCGSILS
jgi:hypothetical protein